MAWVVTLSLLLAVLVSTILTNVNIMKEGEKYKFKMSDNPDYCLLFRTSAEENLLLFNSSNPSPEISTLTADFRSQLELIKDQDRVSHFKIVSLIPSDSGQYRMQCWRNNSATNKDINLLVCSHRYQKDQYVDIGDTVDLSCDETRDDENMTVQWYKTDGDAMLMLEKSSSLHINVSMEKSYLSPSYYAFNLHSLYGCALLEEQLCVSDQRFNLYIKRHSVVVSVGEKTVLSCFNPDDPTGTETVWRHDLLGDIIWDPSPLTRREKQMHVTDGRRSGNVSLIIPSLMLNHSGMYLCMKKNEKLNFIKMYDLLVCPKSETEPLTEFFSEGDQVVVRCNTIISNYDYVVWYRRTAEVEHDFWSTRYSEPDMAQDLDGRINASNRGSVLVLSNLSLKDTGEYGCAVFYGEKCISLTKTLLLYWDPFGINSTFYRVYSTLMGCALLGMVCALITVNLKTRRRDQKDLSPDTETEEQQSGRGDRRE